MKNVFLLPTEQPSRLWVNNLLQGKLELSEEILIGSNTAQHIYITSDEGIKKGDWFIDENENKIYYMMSSSRLRYDNCKKIILTTDANLIADGVQSIDNEFLEWFVKNPTCKFVEVEFKTKQLVKPYDVYNEQVSYYKIIVPKEETKALSQDAVISSPIKLHPILAEIEHINDLGLSHWYEVVYYDDKWYSYSGSKTFQDGERVVKWKYAKDCL